VAVRARRVPGPGGEGKWAYTRDAKTPQSRPQQMGEGASVCAPNNTGFHLQPRLPASGTFVHPGSRRRS